MLYYCHPKEKYLGSFFLQNMNKFFITTLLVAAVFAFPSIASADTSNCQPIYGGGQTCKQEGNVIINKTVQRPGDGAFVENLGVNDPKYLPGQTITFNIVVTNNGGSQVDKVTIKDILPQYVDFVSGGNFDKNANTITFDAPNLKANESRTFSIMAKVVDQSKLPTDKSIICVINQAMVTTHNQTNQDNAQLCIEKQVQPTPQPGQPQPTQPVTKGGLKVFPKPQVTTTPPTGPEALALVALLPVGMAGYFLRKKSSIK